jgi:hypothetical protein
VATRKDRVLWFSIVSIIYFTGGMVAIGLNREYLAPNDWWFSSIVAVLAGIGSAYFGPRAVDVVKAMRSKKIPDKKKQAGFPSLFF